MDFLASDAILDFLYFIDIIFNFFTAYFDEYDNLVFEQRLIIKKYMKYEIKIKIKKNYYFK